MPPTPLPCPIDARGAPRPHRTPAAPRRHGTAAIATPASPPWPIAYADAHVDPLVLQLGCRGHRGGGRGCRQVYAWCSSGHRATSQQAQTPSAIGRLFRRQAADATSRCWRRHADCCGCGGARSLRRVVNASSERGNCVITGRTHSSFLLTPRLISAAAAPSVEIIFRKSNYFLQMKVLAAGPLAAVVLCACITSSSAFAVAVPING